MKPGPISDELLALMAEKFRMLSDPTRLAILRALMNSGELTVTGGYGHWPECRERVKAFEAISDRRVVGTPKGRVVCEVPGWMTPSWGKFANWSVTPFGAILRSSCA
jgi:DNA-binding transcriptional ArsR family regulator